MIHVPFAKATLDNGLDVIVHEDHHAPLVAVSIWYHVGSKNERPGLTGLAHLFEHLMFEGSPHQPEGYFAPLQEAGGALNGSTSTDRTNYWELVPSEALRLALWMEADRMGWLLPALSQVQSRAQSTKCLSNLRQIGQATLLYANLNKGHLMQPVGTAIYRFSQNTCAQIDEVMPAVTANAPT